MENQNTSAQASDTTEPDLAALVENRRTELGIEPSESDSAFTSIVSRLRELPETKSEAQVRQDEIAAAKRTRKQAELDRGTRLVSGAGDRYRLCRLESFAVNPEEPHATRQRKVIATLREYLADLPTRLANREGLVLYGPVGTGKDHLAYAVAREFVLAGYPVVWLNGQDWFGDVRDAIDTDTPEGKIINQITRPAVAVISDPLPPIGSLTQHQATMLYRAIDDRYIAGKLTIVTLNVADGAEADARIGVATWDRLGHSAWRIQCKWPSYRQPAREVRP